jgi:hypothetical protein
MENKPDPYAWADGLIRLANDVAVDVTSLTISDITETLRNTAAVLADLADEYYSLRTDNEVFLEVAGTKIDITPYIPEGMYQEFVKSYVIKAVQEYLNEASV